MVRANSMLRAQPAGAASAKPTATISTGLGYLGLNEMQKARTELTEAVQASPDLLGARTTLATLK